MSINELARLRPMKSGVFETTWYRLRWPYILQTASLRNDRGCAEWPTPRQWTCTVAPLRISPALASLGHASGALTMPKAAVRERADKPAASIAIGGIADMVLPWCGMHQSRMTQLGPRASRRLQSVATMRGSIGFRDATPYRPMLVTPSSGVYYLVINKCPCGRSRHRQTTSSARSAPTIPARRFPCRCAGKSRYRAAA
jgi:hypothetical protein